jgi:hypothetical protein
MVQCLTAERFLGHRLLLSVWQTIFETLLTFSLMGTGDSLGSPWPSNVTLTGCRQKLGVFRRD